MAPLELHVWSRAFGLPSLNAECLAAVSFLSVAIPRSLWVLVESNNTSVSPTGSLPALKDGTKWVGGFDDIVSHVNAKSSGASDIDKNLTSLQKAQVIAYRSLIRQLARPITSLYLYLTPRNYVDVTRPLYSTFLPFPIQYQIPHDHHARAVDLTSHLSALIREISAEESRIPPVSTAFAGLTTAGKSESEKKNKEAKEKITTQVKLRNLLADFLDPVGEKMGKNEYFLGGRAPTTVDCLLFGYLSLLLYPDLPSPWAKEILQDEFTDVVKYVSNLRPTMLPDNIACAPPAAEDKLTVAGWIKRNVETLPSRYFSPPIPFDNNRSEEAGAAAEAAYPVWNIAKGVVGLVAVVGGVFAYNHLTKKDMNVEVEVDDEVGTPVYTAATAQVGSVPPEPMYEEEERMEPLPIFRAEDMLGLKL